VTNRESEVSVCSHAEFSDQIFKSDRFSGRNFSSGGILI
jgi:hypothetical protein